MAVKLSRDIKVKCVAPDKYYPENITKGEWYNVIAVDSWNYKGKDRDGNEKTMTTCKVMVINDKLKVSSIALHNCEVVDVELQKKEETDK